MDGILFGSMLLWLAIVSWFDIRKGEIPHSAWVLLPLAVASVYRVTQGGWQLVLWVGIISIASERKRLAGSLKIAGMEKIPAWIPLLIAGFSLANQVSTVMALAFSGFWLAWELGWWGGADAVSAMVIGLILPGWAYLLAFLATHFIVVLCLGGHALIRKRKPAPNRLPGLPILLATAIILLVLF